MFTGIITGLGRITDSRPLGEAAGHGRRLLIQAPDGYLDDVRLGDSVALNGACMTVTGFDPQAAVFSVDISAESLARTAGLDDAGADNATVNLEKAVRADDRLGGHMVSGHVDGIATVSDFAPIGESWRLRLLTPPELARFLAYKGSITVNGVSLTVNTVTDRADGCELEINLIPHTLEHTSLGSLRTGQRVNIEIDLIARYVERMLTAPKVA